MLGLKILKILKDLPGQWNRIGAAWATFKSNHDETNLAALLTELEAGCGWMSMDVVSESGKRWKTHQISTEKPKKDQLLVSYLLVFLSISWIVCVSLHIFSYLTYFVSIFVSFSSYWGILAAFCDPRCRVCTFSALPKKFSSLRRLWNALTFSVYIRYWSILIFFTSQLRLNLDPTFSLWMSLWSWVSKATLDF